MHTNMSTIELIRLERSTLDRLDQIDSEELLDVFMVFAEYNNNTEYPFRSEWLLREEILRRMNLREEILRRMNVAKI